MEIRKEYTINFSREEVNKIEETVNYIDSLRETFDKATCDMEYNEYPSDLRKLDFCLDHVKRALDEFFATVVVYGKI